MGLSEDDEEEDDEDENEEGYSPFPLPKKKDEDVDDGLAFFSFFVDLLLKGEGRRFGVLASVVGVMESSDVWSSSSLSRGEGPGSRGTRSIMTPSLRPFWAVGVERPLLLDSGVACRGSQRDQSLSFSLGELGSVHLPRFLILPFLAGAADEDVVKYLL